MHGAGSATASAPAVAVRAAAVVLRGELVLLHRRRRESVWALPGGRVELGESAAEALVRELAEELQAQAQVRRLIFLVENIFAHGGTTHHELGLYFLASFPEHAEVCSKDGAFAGAEAEAGLEFCWFNRHGLAGLNLRPSFLVSALAASPLEFSHVVVSRGETEV